MNARVSKAIRKVGKRNWFEYVRELYKLPLRTRTLYAWHIITKYKDREISQG